MLGEKVTISGDDFMPCARTLLIAPIDVPSQEELNVLLERFPIFTNMEPIASLLNELFPIMRQIPVDVIVDP